MSALDHASFDRAAPLGEIANERYFRAHLAAAWREYRDASHLPIAREYARRNVRRQIDQIRAARARMGLTTHRLPSWWDYMPEDAA